MVIFTIIGIVVVVLVIVHYFKESDSGGSSNSGNRNSSSTGTSYSPVGQTQKIPVVKTPTYPSIYEAYKKHYPFIRSAVFNAMSSMNYWEHVNRSSIEAEITCFMFFTAVKFSTDEQKIDAEKFIQELGTKMTDEEATFRLDVYDAILNQEELPRVDWGRPATKYTFKTHEMPYLRAFCAFGDFLINPDCHQDYFNDTPMRSTYIIDSIQFQEFFGNEIFEKISDYTTCFPYQVRYK